MYKIVAVGKGQKKGQRYIVGRGATEQDARAEWLYNFLMIPDFPCKLSQQWNISCEKD